MQSDVCDSRCSLARQSQEVVEVKERDLVNRTGQCPPLPISSATVEGRLEIQDKRNPSHSPWEFCIRKKAELSKLPSYPITVPHCHKGIDCTLKLKGEESSCQAAYHGSPGGIVIGSREKQSRQFTYQYRGFLRSLGITVGVHVQPIPIQLDFRSDSIVYVSRPPSFSGKATTPMRRIPGTPSFTL